MGKKNIIYTNDSLLERYKFCDRDTFSSLPFMFLDLKVFNKRSKQVFFPPFEQIKLKRSNEACGAWIPEIRYWREACLLTFLRFLFNAADSTRRINDGNSGFKGTFTTGVCKIGRVPGGAATSIVIVIADVITVVVVVDVVSRPDLALRAMRLRYANSLCCPRLS